MLNLGIPIEFGPVAGGGGGSKWYAPRTGAPVVLPVASGTNALAAGNWAKALNVGDIAFGYAVWVNGGPAVGIGYNTRDVGAMDVRIGISQTGSVFNNGINVRIGYQNGSLGTNETVTVGIGYLNHTGYYGVAVGYNNYSAGIGCFATGLNSYATGWNVQSHGFYARPVVWGITVNADVQKDTFNRSALNFNGTLVTARTSAIAFGDTVIENAATPVLLNGGVPFWIEADQSTSIEGHLIVRRISDGVSAKWKVSGLVKRAGTVITIVGFNCGVAGAPDISDAGGAGWVMTVGVGTKYGIDHLDLYVNFNSATNTETFLCASEFNIVYPSS